MDSLPKEVTLKPTWCPSCNSQQCTRGGVPSVVSKLSPDQENGPSLMEGGVGLTTSGELVSQLGWALGMYGFSHQLAETWTTPPPLRFLIHRV